MKRFIIYEKEKSSKLLKRLKILGVYESLILNNYNDIFIKDGFKDELGERIPILIRNIFIVEFLFFIFLKDLLKVRKIYNEFKFCKGYKKYINIFFQYKIVEYKNDGFINIDL